MGVVALGRPERAASRSAVVQIKLFLISGALAGLVGMQQILADDGYLAPNYEAAARVHRDRGRVPRSNNPIGIVFAAILWGMLVAG